MHKPTPIPFDIDRLTEEQRRIIREGHESDPTRYLVRTRPVVFQIVGAPNNADETRGPAPIDEATDVLIYGLGESRGEGLVDFGWLEHVETGTRVWEMTAKNTAHAGGDARNRKRASRVTLEPGTYRLRYVSNSHHAFASWEGDPPEHDHLYGVTMFNLTAIPGIDRRLSEAGVPVLATSLEGRSSAPPSTAESKRP